MRPRESRPDPLQDCQSVDLENAEAVIGKRTHAGDRAAVEYTKAVLGVLVMREREKEMQ